MFDFHPKSLARTILTGGDRVHDEMGFRYTLLDNLPLLRTREDNINLSVTEVEAAQFFGDFYGLLTYLKVPVEYFWITCQMNGYSNSTDYDASIADIVVPSRNEINRIKTIYLSVNMD